MPRYIEVAAFFLAPYVRSSVFHPNHDFEEVLFAQPDQGFFPLFQKQRPYFVQDLAVVAHSRNPTGKKNELKRAKKNS